MPNRTYGAIQGPPQVSTVPSLALFDGVVQPRFTTNRTLCPWRLDQGPEQSCIANSTSILARYTRQKVPQYYKSVIGPPHPPDFPGGPVTIPAFPTDIQPSRNFIYYKGRELVGAQHQDAGMQMWEAMQIYQTLGFPNESEWPYGSGTLNTAPPAGVLTDALANIVPTYYWMGGPDPPSLHQWLAAGFAIAFGLNAYSSLESSSTASSGVVPVPTTSDTFIGGHSMLILDYDDRINYYWCLNSWGPGWGIGGLCLFPYYYMHSEQTWDHVVIAVPTTGVPPNTQPIFSSLQIPPQIYHRH